MVEVLHQTLMSLWPENQTVAVTLIPTFPIPREGGWGVHYPELFVPKQKYIMCC